LSSHHTTMAPPFTQPHVEQALKRVRVLFGGEWIVDTKKAKLVWEKPLYPIYYFSADDVPEQHLQAVASTDANPDEEVFDVVAVAGGKIASGAATKFKGNSELAGLVRITFSAMNAWFEEEEQIFGHPKDPYKRVDVLQSARHVRVEVNGVEVANTTKPRLLFETGFPVRTYIPKTDTRVDLLVPSTLTSHCPYKGIANYYSVRVPGQDGAESQLVENIVWWYRTPQLECAEIKGYVAFWDEKVDVWVDGEKQAKA